MQKCQRKLHIVVLFRSLTSVAQKHSGMVNAYFDHICLSVSLVPAASHVFIGKG